MVDVLGSENRRVKLPQHPHDIGCGKWPSGFLLWFEIAVTFVELLSFTSDFPVKDDLLLFDFIESHLIRLGINSVGI